MKKKFLWCMTVLTALLSASCSSELAFEGTSPYDGVTGEEVDVTFSISAEGTQMQTRAGGPGQYQNKVGKGQEIDMLIYAVYEQDDKTGEYTLLKQYGKGIDTENHDDFADGAEAIEAKEIQASEGVSYDGQTILNVGETFKSEDGVETITLRLMRNKQYHIAFWAQSSKTAAFQTNDLKNVKVIYENAKNNDELRDAFCKVESFSVSPSNVARTVILTRPMAQINVGTTGADYKHLLKAKLVYQNKPITQSKITLKGVAQCINVVTDEIVVDNAENKLTTVNFTHDIIPAFMYTQYANDPTTFPDTKEDDSFYYKLTDPKEELLKVDLDGDGKVLSYKINYPTYNGRTFLTETFKYLSMCYVLVPASHTPEGETNVDNDPYKSSVLDEVTITFAETDENGQATKEYETKNLKNVPVHRNWRTNILGGLANIKDSDPEDPDPDDPDNPDPNDPGYIPDPTDPDDPDPDNPPVTPDDPYDPDDDDYPEEPEPGPDDPTSIFLFQNIQIKLDHHYYDEHNGTLGEYDEENNGYEWLEQPEEDQSGAGSTEGDEEGEGDENGEGQGED